ncbi:helix-turn-helix transcriptional regulator [Actinomadura barringtoniae]|uniref:Helix-turn-helix transcriptional regulator n=1 Tax=Actinomadura barringtoniae TaxID=1427535 RepID=A0A939PDH7_9ACTN|nr:AraC family transcriptional regulator [Actinomadura barringtoniae]MBO2448068.1 helix-turn-helix transcriptional regulator [Actinomadura barringtoniae]
MLTSQAVVTSPHYTISRVACADDHTGWSEPEVSNAVQIVLVRRGRFRLDAQGRTVMVDPTTGYLHGPGTEERFAHPAGGDVCTAITFTGDVLTAEPWLRAAIDAASPSVRVDARLELAHRLLLKQTAPPSRKPAPAPAACTGGAEPGADAGCARGAGSVGTDEVGSLDEGLLGLLTLAVRSGVGARVPGPGRVELAERAREAIVAGEGADLVGLAGLLGTTPSHLSRTFRHHVGMTVSRYRNRVRVSRALAAMEGGERDLAGLAVGLGFSDQAHLSRVMRDELGSTPGVVRGLLKSGTE